MEGFLYKDQLKPIAWLDGTGAIKATFVYGDRGNVPSYMVMSNVNYRFVTDHLGSVRMVVNATTGAVMQEMDYDEFGIVVRNTAPGFQPFGFAGGLYDSNTGLVKFGARDYDPQIGRWTAKDPIRFEGGFNFYAYVGNDPVNRIDPRGLADSWINWDNVKDAIYDWLEDKVVDHSGPLPGKEQTCYAQKDQCAQKTSASGNPEDYGFTCEHQETMCNTGMPNALQDPSSSSTSASSSSCSEGDPNSAYWDSLKTNPNYEWKP